MSAYRLAELGVLSLLLASACVQTTTYGNWSRPPGSRSAERRVEADVEHGPDVAHFVLVQLGGDITVRALGEGEGPSRFVAEITAWADSEPRARAIADGVVPRIEAEGDRLIGRVDAPEPPLVDGEGFRVDWTVSLPPGLTAELETSSGDVDARGPLAACRAVSAFGGISVEGVHGDVLLRSSSGDVRAAKIRDAERIELVTSFGDADLTEAACTRAEVRTSSGDVGLRGVVAENAHLHSSFGDVEAHNVRGAVDAGTSSGDVAVIGCEGGAIDAESSFGDVVVRGRLHRLRAVTQSGDVRIVAAPGSTCEAPWKIHTAFGDARIGIPPEFGAELRARTSFGSIAIRVPMATAGSARDKKSVDGVIGGGGEILEIDVGSGSVAVHAVEN